MNASWQCGVCYSCWLPGPELRQLVFLIRLLWWSPPFSACLRISVLCTAFARASSRGLCSERICAHAPLPCMNKPQQSANIRCYHHSPRRFNWIQIRFCEPFLCGIFALAWQDIHFSAGMEPTWWVVLLPHCLVSSKIHLHVKGNEMIARSLVCLCGIAVWKGMKRNMK